MKTKGLIGGWLSLLLAVVPSSALGQSEKPNVAILVYDGVQVIDHAIPFEVFGQFSLNNVYTVAENREPVTTYMGMQVVANFSFEEAPIPDVLVLPGGDAGEAQQNPKIAAWIDRMVSEADHILTVCTGIFFLAEHEILSGKQVTTWYERQEELQRVVPDAEVVSDRVVVESGKLVSSAGLGVDGALRVLARLHGDGWAEVVRLNMEHERLPDEHHVPRAELADLKLPSTVYGAFPWREAELLRYEGDRVEWTMEWRFSSDDPLEAMMVRLRDELMSEEGWTFLNESTAADEWTSHWAIEAYREPGWRGVVQLRNRGSQVDLLMNVEKQQVN